MHHPLVFHQKCNLHYQPELSGKPKKMRKVRLLEFVTMIIRVQPDPDHPMLLGRNDAALLPNQVISD